MPSTSSRRRFLLTAAAFVPLVAGCTESSDDPSRTPTETPTETGASPTPTSSPTPTETPTETPEPTPTYEQFDVPQGEIPPPHPDSLPHDVLQVSDHDEQIERPHATAGDDDYRMAYLQSANDLERLDKDALDDDEREFLDETDFSTEVVVAAWVTLHGSDELHFVGVPRESGRLEARLWIEYKPGPIAIVPNLVFVRVPLGDDSPPDATVVIGNISWSDGPIKFGTTDDG